MISWRKQIVPLIAAASLLFGSATMPDVVCRAEEAILIPGATILKPINPFYSIIAENYPKIGINFHDDARPELVDYSQDALNSDKALAHGVEQTMLALERTDGKVVIIGESMGSMVAARVAKELAAGPDAPSTNDVRIVLIAPPEAGVAEYFKEGTFIPILNYRVKRVATSPYPTTVVIGEYDGWADPPDRPWNLLASANALLGIVYVHGVPIAAADPDDVPPGNVTTIPGNEDHGPITTMLVPTKNLPLTQFFRDLGAPDAVVDKFDAVLRPVIDSAYVRHDQPGDTRPYLQNGKIQRNGETQQEVSPSSAEADDAQNVASTSGDTKDITKAATRATDDTTKADARGDKGKKKQTLREKRREHRDGVDKLRKQVESGLNDLTKRLKGPQAKPKRTETESE